MLSWSTMPLVEANMPETRTSLPFVLAATLCMGLFHCGGSDDVGQSSGEPDASVATDVKRPVEAAAPTLQKNARRG